MPRSRALTSAALCAVLATSGLLAATGRSAAAVSPYTVQHITVETRIGPNGDQPCRVDADLYVPKGVSRTHKAPAILSTNGFGGSKDDGNESAIGKGFAGAGYVVLTYSGLGFGSTGCKISLDQPDYDGKAGKQLVDVLAGTKDYTPQGGAPRRLDIVSQEKPGDPRVGMIGGSYGGQIQYAVAAQDKRVDALIPIITWNDLAYSLAPNNTSTTTGVSYATPGVAKREWIDLFSAAGIKSGVQGVTTAGDPQTLGGCPNFVDEVCPDLLQLNTAGYPDASTLDLAKRASVASYVERITAPTLVVQGQGDTLFNLQESVATYRALQKQGTPTKLIWQSWGHSQSTPAPGELDLGAASIKDTYLGRRFLAWMDHYVRGVAKAPTGPEFSYFRDWVRYDTSAARAGKAVAEAYRTASRFSQKPTAHLYLSGADQLVRRRTAVLAGSAGPFSNATGPSYSETSGLEGGQVNNPPSDPAGSFAAWTTAPLKKAAILVGSPTLVVRLSDPVGSAGQSLDAGRLVLFAKIYDVAPNGSKTLQHRLVSPVRVTDVTRPVRIALPGVVQRFAKGHRIQLVLAAGDAAYAGNPAPHPVTVTTSRSAPGVLALPLRSRLVF